MKFYACIILVSVFLCSLAEAKLVQILHTNDLHSYFEGTRFGQGGYARLKTLIDKYKEIAKTEGMETLFVDAGDFGEGSSYFFSNEGVDSLRALDLLGVDVAVLGNHDYMQGGNVLAQQIEAAELKTKIISANLRGKNRLGLKKYMKDDFTVTIDGKKIYIFGLSTAEAHFMYPIAWKGFIRPPLKYFPKLERKARKINADFVIALTHIGLDKDIELAQKSKNIDLIVGGHSHTRLESIRYQLNANDVLTPIVQTGAQGMALGRIILDLQPNHESKIVSYELLDVNDKVKIDEKMMAFVETAKAQREKYFSRSWDEILGKTEITLSGYGDNGHMNSESTCWGMHLANLAQTVAETDIGVHHSSFEGEEIQAGDIRFGDMIDNFPHFRHFGDQGWEIVRSNLPGWAIKKVLNLVRKKPGMSGMSITGLEWPKDMETLQIPYDPHYAVNNAMINGQKIRNLKSYSMAYTSEMVYAIKKMLPGISKIFLPKLRYTREYYWPKLEEYIRKNSPLTCELPKLELGRGKHH